MKNSFYENDPSIPGKQDSPKRIVTDRGRVLHRTEANHFKYNLSGTGRQILIEDRDGGTIFAKLVTEEGEGPKVSGYDFDKVIDLAIIAWADPATT